MPRKYINHVWILFGFVKNSQDKKTNFLKVHAPWEILARYADILNLQRPVKVEGYLILVLIIDHNYLLEIHMHIICRWSTGE